MFCWVRLHIAPPTASRLRPVRLATATRSGNLVFSVTSHIHLQLEQAQHLLGSSHLRKFTYSFVHRCVRHESKLLCVLLDSAITARHLRPPDSLCALRFRCSKLDVARPFRKTLAFGSFEGLLETWASFCAQSRRYVRASFFQHVVCRGIWVQARHMRPRASTWWQSYARLKSSARISGDVKHTNKWV